MQEKGAKQVRKLKQWKDHVEQWGLNPNYHHVLSLSGRLNTMAGAAVSVTAGKGALQKGNLATALFRDQHEKEVKQQQTGNLYPYRGKEQALYFQ